MRRQWHGTAADRRPMTTSEPDPIEVPSTMGDDLLRKYAGAGAEGAGYAIEEETIVERGVEEGVEEREDEAAGIVHEKEKVGIKERIKRLIDAE